MTAATLAAAVRDAGAQWPDRPFLICGERTVTYAEFDTLSDVVAGHLAAMGYGPGDRLAVAAPNSVEWIALWLGAAKLGVIVVTLNVRYREAEFTYMLDQSGAKGLVCSATAGGFDFVEFFAPLRDRLPDVRDYLFLGRPEGDGLFTGAPVGSAPDVRPENPAVILYTSGTTGRPKGATLTHRSILASAGAQAAHLGQDGDRIVGTMPLNHVGGLSVTVTSCLITGGTVDIVPAFSPGEVLELAERHRITILAGVPTMWTLMLSHETAPARDLDSVRLAIIGGSNLEPAMAQRISARLPHARLINLYGLSEVSGTAALSRLNDDPATVARTLGVVIGGYEWRVVDADGAPAEHGELLLRGPAVAAGYWDMPEETAATFDADGWLHTGDVVQAEADGHLVFRARLKEMYLQGGYNVYPVEVENVLGQHPDVVQAAGIGIPDDVLGAVGRYFVQRRPGTTVTDDELRAWCAERLANYKVPREIVFVDEFPLTPAGKVHKAVLPRG
jgi:fatty-acyl-CoA synthase